MDFDPCRILHLVASLGVLRTCDDPKEQDPIFCIVQDLQFDKVAQTKWSLISSRMVLLQVSRMLLKFVHMLICRIEIQIKGQD